MRSIPEGEYRVWYRVDDRLMVEFCRYIDGKFIDKFSREIACVERYAPMPSKNDSLPFMNPADPDNLPTAGAFFLLEDRLALMNYELTAWAFTSKRNMQQISSSAPAHSITELPDTWQSLEAVIMKANECGKTAYELTATKALLTELEDRNAELEACNARQAKSIESLQQQLDKATAKITLMSRKIVTEIQESRLQESTKVPFLGDAE